MVLPSHSFFGQQLRKSGKPPLFSWFFPKFVDLGGEVL